LTKEGPQGGKKRLGRHLGFQGGGLEGQNAEEAKYRGEGEAEKLTTGPGDKKESEKFATFDTLEKHPLRPKGPEDRGTGENHGSVRGGEGDGMAFFRGRTENSHATSSTTLTFWGTRPGGGGKNWSVYLPSYCKKGRRSKVKAKKEEKDDSGVASSSHLRRGIRPRGETRGRS